MEVKALFAETVKKMKRLDFLSDFVRRKTEEKNKISDEVAVFRKKNGKIGNNEYDIYIFQSNAKISEIEKSIEKCKIEMKALKGVISSGLRECYAKTPDPDFIRRVELAYKHVFGEKNRLVTTSDAGGIFGDTKIVGAVVTHDKTKRCAVKECVRAGERNQAGRLTAKPEIIVWDFDKNKTEGEFRIEDDGFKSELEKRRSSELKNFSKETFSKPVVTVSLTFAAVISLFLVLFAASKVTSNISGGRFMLYFIIGVVLVTAFSVPAVLSAKAASAIDGAGILAFVLSVVTGVIYGVTSPNERLILPCFLLVYSVAIFVSRFVLRKKEKIVFSTYSELSFAAVGVFLAFMISEFDTETVFQTATSAITYFSAVAVSLGFGVGSLFYKKVDCRRYGFLSAIFGVAFASAASFLANGLAEQIISAAVASTAAFVAAVLAKKQSDGDKNNEI